VRKGVSRATLTRDSPSAHPAHEVAGVKAAWWWVSGKVSSVQISFQFCAKTSQWVSTVAGLNA